MNLISRHRDKGLDFPTRINVIDLLPVLNVATPIKQKNTKYISFIVNKNFKSVNLAQINYKITFNSENLAMNN